MADTKFRARWLSRILAIAATAVLTVACVSGGDKKTGSVPMVDIDGPQPRSASYACADGGLVTIENLGASVKVLGPDGENTELPASPANQRNRYGAAADAIVIEGREVLFMKSGQEPLTCTRA